MKQYCVCVFLEFSIPGLGLNILLPQAVGAVLCIPAKKGPE